MKLIITAGGGGHFAPTLAVIQKLPKDWEVLFVGRKYAFEADKTLSFEYTTAEKMGIPFFAVHAARLQRHWNRHTIPALLRFPKAFLATYTKVKAYKPDLVLSFGGYVSVPVVLAAAALRIPVVIHEQTLKAGLANRIAARFAKTICVSWEQSAQYFPKEKTVVTGNPLKLTDQTKADFFRSHSLSEQDASLPLVYITGGSLGSHVINEYIHGSMEKLLEKYVVIHQTGDAQEYNDFALLSEKRAHLSEKLQQRYILTKFVPPYEVGSILQRATLVIARAGMSTVTELLAFGKPALFIPLPFAQNNEQMENALFFKRQGLGEVFEQKNLSSEKLYEHIVSMVTHIDRYEKHSPKAKDSIRLHAAEDIITVCQNALSEHAYGRSN